MVLKWALLGSVLFLSLGSFKGLGRRSGWRRSFRTDSSVATQIHGYILRSADVNAAAIPYVRRVYISTRLHDFYTHLHVPVSLSLSLSLYIYVYVYRYTYTYVYIYMYILTVCICMYNTCLCRDRERGRERDRARARETTKTRGMHAKLALAAPGEVDRTLFC